MLEIRQDQIAVLDEFAMADCRTRLRERLKPQAAELPRAKDLDLVVWVDTTIARAFSYGFLTVVHIEEFAQLAFELEFGTARTPTQSKWAKSVLAESAFPADYRLRLVRSELEGTIARAGQNGAFFP